MKIQDMSRTDLINFFAQMSRELGVVFIADPAVGQKLIRFIWDKLTTRLGRSLDDWMPKLRPMCWNKAIYLPFVPGCDNISQYEQVRIAIHECTHSLRIRGWGDTVRKWYGCYFTDETFRAYEETACQKATAGFEYWLCGTLQPFDLTGYSLSANAIKQAYSSYSRHLNRLSDHGRSKTHFEATGEAIKILKGLGVEPQ
jgi:hypothetical protein